MRVVYASWHRPPSWQGALSWLWSWHVSYYTDVKELELGFSVLGFGGGAAIRFGKVS